MTAQPFSASKIYMVVHAESPALSKVAESESPSSIALVFANTLTATTPTSTNTDHRLPKKHACCFSLSALYCDGMTAESLSLVLVFSFLCFFNSFVYVLFVLDVFLLVHSFLEAYVLTLEVMTVEKGLKSWKSVQGCSVEAKETNVVPTSLSETIIMTQVKTAQDERKAARRDGVRGNELI